MAIKKKTKKAAMKQKKSVKKTKAPKRAAPKKSAMTGVKPSVKKAVSKKANLKRALAKKTPVRRIRGKADHVDLVAYENTGLGAQTGGQSGDTQGLSGVAETDSESVKELLEEGQSFEAEVLEGVENVPDADQGEVRTHQVPENDVPGEYLDKD